MPAKTIRGEAPGAVLGVLPVAQISEIESNFVLCAFGFCCQARFNVPRGSHIKYQRVLKYMLTLNTDVAFRDVRGTISLLVPCQLPHHELCVAPLSCCFTSQWELFLHHFGPFEDCLHKVRQCFASVARFVRLLVLPFRMMTLGCVLHVQMVACFFSGDDLALAPWFHGPISRARAQTLLHAGVHASRTGHFLVRFSGACPECFTLSYLCQAQNAQRVVMRNVLLYNLGKVRVCACSLLRSWCCVASSLTCAASAPLLNQAGYSVFHTASPDRCFPSVQAFVAANSAKLGLPVRSSLARCCDALLS